MRESVGDEDFALLPGNHHFQMPADAHWREFNNEPGFTRVVPMKEIQAKVGSLGIPLYVGRETQAQTDATTESAATALPDSLVAWLESSRKVRG